MKFRGLLFANLFRKKTRLVLTLGSFAVALFLFSLLALVKQAWRARVVQQDNITCDHLVHPHGDFAGPARKAFCTNLLRFIRVKSTKLRTTWDHASVWELPD